MYKPEHIFDLGMNNGRDSEFYLRKGFKVVAVEANPLLALAGRMKLSRWIDDGRLIIENVALGPSAGVFPFYVNTTNDHWSSFDKEIGTREGTSYTVVEVPFITPAELFERHGIPYYLKVDLEGMDREVVRGLSSFDVRPRFLSVEENHESGFEELRRLGYNRFKLVDQTKHPTVKCPFPPLEGEYVDASFDGTTSGPFGRETPGEWKDFDAVVQQYRSEVRDGWVYRGPAGAWFDIHATVEQ